MKFQRFARSSETTPQPIRWKRAPALPASTMTALIISYRMRSMHLSSSLPEAITPEGSTCIQILSPAPSHKIVADRCRKCQSLGRFVSRRSPSGKPCSASHLLNYDRPYAVKSSQLSATFSGPHGPPIHHRRRVISLAIVPNRLSAD